MACRKLTFQNLETPLKVVYRKPIENEKGVQRFMSVDPLQFDYPYYTPYQYAGNKPISYIDLDGLEPTKPEEDGSAQKQTELPKSSEDESINKQIQFYFDEYGANGDFSANVESEDGKFVKGSVTMNVGDDIVLTVDLLPGDQVSGILDNNTNQEIGYNQAFGFSIYTPEGGAESATEKAKTTEMMNGEWLAALTSRRASLRFRKGPLTLASALNKIKGIISILIGKQGNQNDQDTQTTPDKDIKPDNKNSTVKPTLRYRAYDVKVNGEIKYRDSIIHTNSEDPQDSVIFRKFKNKIRRNNVNQSTGNWSESTWKKK